MFSLAVKNINTSYIQNNGYALNTNSMPIFVPSFVSAPESNHLGGCNSVFTMPYMRYSPYCPSYSLFGGFMMPFGAMWSGCCSGARRFFDMMMTMQLFQSTMNAFSKLSNRNNYTSTYSSYPSLATQSQYLTPWTYRTTPSAKSYSPTYNYSSIPVSSASLSGRSLSISTRTNLPQLKDIGYNAEKGQALAQAAASNTVGFTGYCAKYVRMALQKAGLYNGMKADGADYDDVLRNNSNFKEISANGINLSSLPAGCILVYERGTAGYSSQYGHVEITTGNGQAVSDGVTTSIKPGAKIFVPV